MEPIEPMEPMEDVAIPEPQRIGSFYPARLLLTFLLLGLYNFAGGIPLPGIDRLAAAEMGLSSERTSLRALGLNPLVAGFLVVELISLIIPRLRRLRRQGADGRARLNRAALGLSLALAAAQALGMALFFENTSGPSSLPLANPAGLGFRLLVVLTLTGATAVVFLLGQTISAYGVVNGFVLLFLGTRLRSLQFQEPDAPASPVFILAAVVLAVVGLVRWFRSADDAWIPAFPQGALPVPWAIALATPPTLLIFNFNPLLARSPTATAVFFLGTVPLLSWVAFHLFSSRPRLYANRTDPEEALAALAASVKRRAVLATVLLTAGTAAILLWFKLPLGLVKISLLFELIALVAAGLDVWDQFRFERRVGVTARLCQLDNVHFSYQLEERLQEEGVDALARGHLFRSLLFFFGPLFKIDLLVAAPQLDRAKEVLAELEMAREVAVF